MTPPPKPEKPKTPKGKIQNYWYHYKWATIAGVAIVALVVFFIYEMVTKPKYDYEILLVTSGYIDSSISEEFSSELARYAKDLDGNGEVNITVDLISLNSADPQMAMANQQKLIANLAVRDKCFYIVDDDVYNQLYNISKPKDDSGEIIETVEGEPIFSPIEVDDENISDKHNYWNWRGSDLQKNEKFKTLPENLYFGVRDFETKSGEPPETQISAMELLKNVITNTEVSRDVDTETSEEN